MSIFQKCAGIGRRDGEAFHAAAECCLDAGNRVLDDQAVLRRNADTASGFEEHSRVGLAGHFSTRNHGREIGTHA